MQMVLVMCRIRRIEDFERAIDPAHTLHPHHIPACQRTMLI
jgi:hypothetical protein